MRSVSANTGQAIDATIAVLASHVEHADTLPIISPQTLRCHNGALTVYFRHGELSLSEPSALIFEWQKQEIIHPDAQDFINRLQKIYLILKDKRPK